MGRKPRLVGRSVVIQTRRLVADMIVSLQNLLEVVAVTCGFRDPTALGEKVEAGGPSVLQSQLRAYSSQVFPMYELNFVPVVLVILAMLLQTRLSSNPVRLFRSGITETGANTFTTKSIDLPISVIGTNTIHGVEMQWLDWYLTNPANEDDQSNSILAQITKDPETAIIERQQENFLWGREKNANNNFTTSGSSVYQGLSHKRVETADFRGRGTLLADSIIHHAIEGIGNPSTERSEVIGHGYIVRLTGGDAIQLLLEEDD